MNEARLGILLSVVAMLAGAAVWVFSLGAASARYVTVEQRAADVAQQTAREESLKRDIYSLELRTTRIETKQDAQFDILKEVKEAVNKPSKR